MDAKTIRKIIADLNDRQAHLLARLRRISDEKLEIEAEVTSIKRALIGWNGALIEIEKADE